MNKVLLGLLAGSVALYLLQRRQTPHTKPAYRPIGLTLTNQNPEADCLSRGGYYYDQTCRMGDKLYAVLSNPPPPQWVQIGGQVMNKPSKQRHLKFIGGQWIMPKEA